MHDMLPCHDFADAAMILRLYAAATLFDIDAALIFAAMMLTLFRDASLMLPCRLLMLLICCFRYSCHAFARCHYCHTIAAR